MLAGISTRGAEYSKKLPSRRHISILHFVSGSYTMQMYDTRATCIHFSAKQQEDTITTCHLWRKLTQARHSTARCFAGSRLRVSLRCGSQAATMKNPSSLSSADMFRYAFISAESRAAECHEDQ